MYYRPLPHVCNFLELLVQVGEVDQQWGWRRQQPDDALRDDEVAEEAEAGKIQVSSISTTISSSAGLPLLCLTADAHRQDYYKPGWFVTTVMYHPALLEPVKAALNAAAGPDGCSYVLRHGQQLLQLPIEDKTGLSGVPDLNKRGAGLMEFDAAGLVHTPAVYDRACNRYGSVRRGLHAVPEEAESVAMAEVAENKAKVEAHRQQQQQQQASSSAAAAAAAQVPLRGAGDDRWQGRQP
jgi:hypothetical protein